MPNPLTWPERPAIELDAEVTLRRWSVADAAALADAVTANLDHLRPWMPWIASEPATLDDRVELLTRWERDWQEGSQRNWALVVGGRVRGSIGLMGRVGPGGLEVGYWLDRLLTGRGIVTRAAAALTGHALSVADVQRVEIHHDRANEASSGVPRRLGYRLVDRHPEPIGAPGESGETWVWRVTRAEWSDGRLEGSSP